MNRPQLLELVEELSRICDDVEGSATYMDEENWQSCQRDLAKWATQLHTGLDGLRCGLMEPTPPLQTETGAASARG